MIDIIQRQSFHHMESSIKDRKFENSAVTQSNVVNMDDKEQADRMAAAEAMSSLSSMILIRETPTDVNSEKSKQEIKNKDEKSKTRKKDSGHSTDVGVRNGNRHTTSSTSKSQNSTTNVNCNVPNIIDTAIDIHPSRVSPSQDDPSSQAQNKVSMSLLTALSNALGPRMVRPTTAQQPVNLLSLASIVKNHSQAIYQQAAVRSHLPIVHTPSGPTASSHSTTFNINSKLRERLLASGAHGGSNTQNDAPKSRPVPVSLVINQSVIRNAKQMEAQSGVRSQKANKSSRKTAANGNNVKSVKTSISSGINSNKTTSSLLPSDSLIETVGTISVSSSNESMEHEMTKDNQVSSHESKFFDKKKSDSKLPLKKRRVNYESEEVNPRSLLANMSRLNVAKHSTNSAETSCGREKEVADTSTSGKSNDTKYAEVSASQSHTEVSSELTSTSSTSGVTTSSSTNSNNSNILAQVVAIAAAAQNAGVGAPTIKVDPQTSLKFLSEIHAALTPDEDGDLPLHIAVVQEHLPLVQKFVQLMSISKKSVDRYNKDQQTPLHLAVKLNFVPGVRVLLAARANPNLVDRTGSSSIHIAVKENLMDCLSVLIRDSNHPVELNSKDFEGMAPLHTAVMNNNIGIASLLLSRHIDVDNMDGKSGRTPIYHAAEKKLCEMVYLLIKKGANPDIANYAGVTAIAAAQSRNLSEIAAIMSRGLSDIINRNSVTDGKDTKELLSNYLAEKAEKSPPEDDSKSDDNSFVVMDTGSETGSPAEPMDLSSSMENLIPKPAISPNVSEDYTNR